MSEERTEVVQRERMGWTAVVEWGLQGLDRCWRDRMPRCPESLASGPGGTRRGIRLQKQRINRSIIDRVTVNVRSNLNVDTRTHENENPISALLPAIGHLVVIFLCNLRIYGIDLPRALIGVGWTLRCLRQLRLKLFRVIICFTCR